MLKLVKNVKAMSITYLLLPGLWTNKRWSFFEKSAGQAPSDFGQNEVSNETAIKPNWTRKAKLMWHTESDQNQINKTNNYIFIDVWILQFIDYIW